MSRAGPSARPPAPPGDPINGFEYLSEAYQRSYPGYDDRYSVPVLWDRATGQIVNNESSEIIVMLNGAFNEWAEHPEVDLYPAAPARGDRRAQRVGLQRSQQRRLPRGLRLIAGGL